MKTAIVVTTINVPILLDAYASDVVKHGRQEDVTFFVVSDQKTPDEAETFLEHLGSKYGVRCRWIGAKEQTEFLLDYPRLALPWNCVQRRNIGHLMAWKEGFDIIVALDDDNFIASEDYIGGHLKSFSKPPRYSTSSLNGWFNCCSGLSDKSGKYFFPRGYPIKPRSDPSCLYNVHTENPRIIVNAGLWLGNPDIDAVTRLSICPDINGFTWKDSIALSQGTWCPFNSQNTAVHRDAVPAWFMSPHVGRYDDIWASYIVLACAQHLRHTVSFGQPLVRQDRNQHDLWNDLDLERMGMQITDDFCDVLRKVDFTASTYISCARQALAAINRWVYERGDNSSYFNELHEFVAGYQIWLDCFS